MTTINAPKFAVGDIVSWINHQGVKFPEKKVIEVEAPCRVHNEYSYFLEPSDAPWMPVQESCLMADALDPVVAVVAGQKIRNLNLHGAAYFLVGVSRHYFATLELAEHYAEQIA